MDNQYLKAKEILKKYNQEHLLAFYDKLTQEKKEKTETKIKKNPTILFIKSKLTFEIVNLKHLLNQLT